MYYCEDPSLNVPINLSVEWVVLTTPLRVMIRFMLPKNENEIKLNAKKENPHSKQIESTEK